MNSAYVESLPNHSGGNCFMISLGDMSYLKGHFYRVLSFVGDTAKKVNQVMAEIVCDVVQLQNTARFGAYTAAAVEIAKGCTQIACKNVHDSLLYFSDFIDATRLFVNGNVFVSGEWKKKVIEGHQWSIAGQACLVTSGIAGFTLWLAEAGVVNLAKLSHAVGRLKIFNFLGEAASLRNFVLSTAGIGLVFLGIDALLQISGGQHVTQSWLDLTNCVAETALIVFFLAGGSCPVTHVLLGLAAAGTGLGAFIYKVTRPEPKKDEVLSNSVDATCGYGVPVINNVPVMEVCAAEG